VKPGRPTDYLPPLLPTDVLYACGAPSMVDSVKSIAAHIGAACYADPFLPSTDHTVEGGILSRAMGWLAVQTSWRMRRLALDRPRVTRQQRVEAYGMAEQG
jgi:3-phenylpropionate/trans-cinnamate dioxygenase ferredoxin reductase subunit